MPDPVAQRNAQRANDPSPHRVDDIRFRYPAANLVCTCGWGRSWDEYEPGEVEAAWSEHRRLNGVRTK